MHTLDNLLTEHYTDLAPADSDAITAAAVGWLLRVRTAKDLTAAIRTSIPDARVIDFRKDLQNAYWLRNIKLWIWRVVQDDMALKPAWRMMDAYEIRDEDAEIMRTVLRDDRLARSIAARADHYPAHRLRRYDEILGEIMEELHQFITKFVYRKLRFIAMGGAHELDDLVTDMKMYALYGMRLQYPVVESRLHLVNVAKRTLHNFGMNMISQHTTKSRQSLRQEQDGTFSAIKISIDAMQGGYDYVVSDPFSDANAVPDVIDQLSIRKALETISNPKHRQFVNLLLGHHDEAFSEWLHGDGDPDNDELLDILIQRDNVKEYVELAAQFSDISLYRANVILNDLRSQL